MSRQNGAAPATARTVSEGREERRLSERDGDLRSRNLQTCQAWTLHYASSAEPLATVARDSAWPEAWRITWPDGTRSDLGSFSRVCDAAFAAAIRGRDWRRLRWRNVPIGNGQNGSPMRLPDLFDREGVP
jgi:hypothetical protein